MADTILTQHPQGKQGSWYVTTVKLDLEARGMVARVPHTRPQRVVLTGAG